MFQRFAVVALGLCLALPAARADNSDSIMRGWSWWRSLSESAREQVAPKLIDFAGKAGERVELVVDTLDNVSRYRALCGKKSGAFRQTALCRGLQFKFGERSAWSTVFLGLYRRAGVGSPPARDAAALLAGLRRELHARSAAPQILIKGLYEEIGRCAPPACDPGLAAGSELKTLLSASVTFMIANGNDAEILAAKSLSELGWQ